MFTRGISGIEGAIVSLLLWILSIFLPGPALSVILSIFSVGFVRPFWERETLPDGTTRFKWQWYDWIGLVVIVVAVYALWSGVSPTELLARVEGRQLPDRQSLDAFTLQKVMQKYRVPGVSVAIIKNFEIHWAKGYGVAAVETGLPVDPHTLFQAASISKPVTAMAVLKAVEEGRVSLDADINEMLKSWKVPQGEFTQTLPVTPRSLLSHTSGADDGFGFPGYHPSQLRPTLVQILAGEQPSNVGPVRFARPPFTAFKYSGGGTTIVQLAMIETLGKPFAAIMQHYVLDPLGMVDSTYEQPLPSDREAGRPRPQWAGQGHGREMACLS